MAKSLILANGNIFVGLNQSGLVSDFYFPYVGSENHVRGEPHKIGIWHNEKLSWIDSGEWNIQIDLDKDTFVGSVKCFNKETNLEVVFTNVVYNEKNIFIRKVTITNHNDRPENIKIFFHQVFSIYGTKQEDTAYYDPIANTLIHYEGKRIFLIYAEASDIPFNDYTVGLYGIEGKEGTYKDAEDGELSKNGIEHGHVDSTMSIPIKLHSKESKEVYYWITVGETKAESYDLHEYVKHKSPDHMVESTSKFWRAWLTRQDYLKCEYTDERQVELFKKSLFYIRGNIDNRGAIIASGDSDMLQGGRDTYSYMWPRDGAMTVMALLEVGEYNLSKHFFKFCNDVLEPDGYLMHKYRSDKSLGSSWEPFVRNGQPILPIQEDETALVLIALWEYYQKTKDIDFIEGHYNDVIKKMSTFLVDFIDKDTGLPKPSYDLWEEKHGTSTFTSCTVYGALVSAEKFARLFGKEEEETLYKNTSNRMRESILHYLYDDELKMFIKQISTKNNEIINDKTIDMSSIYGIFNYGVLPVDDERVIASIKTIEEKLRINTGIDGVPRYEHDKYYEQGGDVPNPWYITTLWLAQYYIQKATVPQDLEVVKKWLSWVVTHSPLSGVLSEQVHPFTGEQLSATPLTWSHAEYVRTVMLYRKKLEKYGLCAIIEDK